MTDRVTVTSLSTSHLHKTNVATFHLCQIALNRKLQRVVFAGSCQTEHYLVNLKSGVNFYVAVQKNLVKRDILVL